MSTIKLTLTIPLQHLCFHWQANRSRKNYSFATKTAAIYT